MNKKGCIINLKVHPKSAREKIELKDDLIEIWVKKPPEKGEANYKVIELLSLILKIPKSYINIKSGVSSHNKIVYIDGLERDKVIEKIYESKFTNSRNNHMHTDS